jgi:hypothetical protein
VHSFPARKAYRPEGGTILLSESSAPGSVPAEVRCDDKAHLGWDVQGNLSREMSSIFHSDGVRSISWIKVDSADVRERCPRRMGSGAKDRLEKPFWRENGLRWIRTTLG